MTRLAAVIAIAASLAAAFTASHAFAKDEIVIDLVNEPSSLDPQMQWNPDSYYVYRNIFDNLVTRDNEGKIVPQVATAWQQLSDTEVEFTLRDDIRFHDGTPLTAEDVVFSVERITDKDFGSPQLGQFNKIVKAEARDDHTVVLTTDGPYPVLLAQLVKLSIVPKHVVEAAGKDGFNEHPVGSGPYKFGSWTRGVEVTLERNDDYWGDKGAFAAARFRAVPDASTRLADLQAGTADLAVSLDSDLASQLDGAPGTKVLSAPTERVGYLGMNLDRSPFDDIEMRRAVAMAIDRQGIVEGILAGGEKVVGEVATPAHFGWVEGIEPLAYDPDAAKAIVAAAGDTAKVKVDFATAPVFDQRIVQAIQQMLADVGFEVEINMTDMATYLKAVQSPRESRPTLSFGRWSCACQDVDGVLFPLLHSSSNWSRYADAEMDKLLEEGRSSLDETERLTAYKAVHQKVKDGVLLLPLYQATAIYGASDKLDWQPTANESMFLTRMGWSE